MLHERAGARERRGALPRLGASGPPVRRSRKPPAFYFSRSRMPSTSDGEICVIFATLQNSFYAATVRDKFSIPMSRVYYSQWGVSHGVSGRQAVHRRVWPQDKRQSRRCVLECAKGNRQGAECYPLGSGRDDRFRAPARQSFVNDSPVRARGLSQATVRPQRRSHHGVNFLGRGMSFGLVAAARATQKQPQNKGLCTPTSDLPER
jgi:hypothetical protein